MKPDHLKALLLLATLQMTACDGNDPEPVSATSQDKTETPEQVKADTHLTTAEKNRPMELTWEALMPKDWQIDDLIDEYNTSTMEDDAPQAQLIMDKIKHALKDSPVVQDYNGKTVRLPGYIVPLEMDTKEITEFLLVPYFGACIHVPPPPANQTVHVITDEKHAYRGELFDTVWVTGTLSVEKSSSELGDAGYRIDARQVEPYQ